MKRPNGRHLIAAAFAASLVACGGIQGAASGIGASRVGTQGDAHLTEYDSNDTSSGALRDGGDSSGDSSFGPALIP